MSTDYNYDEQGQFFPYFIITITAIVTIPITYSALRPSKELENTAPRIQSDYRPGDADIIDKQRRKVKRKQRRLKRLIAAAVGWAVMAWMVYLMAVTQRTAVKIWDPYEVLGVSRSASEAQIKKYYRRLSITMHPDKRQPDPEKNQTVESISDDWVEMTKAFKTLTDEEIRNNYLQFGHPDGKQSFSIGIALPQFIVTEGNGKYVLLLYSALVGVVLPALVGSWWYGSQKMTKEQVLVASAERMFKEYEEEMNEGQVIGALSGGQEFQEVVKPDASFASVERMVLKSDDKTLGLTNDDRKKLSSMDDEQRRQALGLLWAYIGRADLGEATLNEQKYASAPLAFTLNESFSTMAPFFGNTQPLLSSHHVSQSIVQAIPPGASPLLQLPHITPELAQLVDAETGIKNTSIQTLMSMPDSRRRKMLNITSSEYSTAMTVASQLPYARIEKAFFKVTGERCITPGSLLQLVVKLRIIPPGYAPIPPVDPKDLEDPDPKEGDLDALHGRKKKRPAVKDEKGNVVGGSDEDDKPIQPPLAHAPFFPQDRSPRWRIFLAENKSGKIAVPPFTFSTFDKPLFHYPQDGGAPTPTCNIQTLKCQFQAPPQVAEYPFTMHLMCDSYVGFDSTVDVIMKVEDMAQAEEVDSDDEISEPDEESLAGQMAALKSGGAPPPKPRRKKQIQTVDDVSSGSDTEGDSGDSSDSDTDTDTSDEE